MKNLFSVQVINHVGHAERLLFTKHLSVMLKSGITLFTAVDILYKQARSHAFKEVLFGIRKELENGQTLSKALARYPHIFNSFFTSLIEVGEASGTLEQNLEYLSNQLVKDYVFRKKIQTALFYPVLVLTFALVVGVSLSLFVLPKLIDLFKELDVDLPLSTQILLGFSQIMRDYGVIIVIVLVAFLILFRFLITISSIKKRWHMFLLSVPLFGRMIRNAQLTTFCRNLGVMLKSGLPLKRALEIEYKTTPNVIFQDYVKRLQASTHMGKILSQELDRPGYAQFPPIAVKMIGVGEKTGKLDEVLIYLADYFEEEVDDDAKNISTILEPSLLLVIGLVVAFVAMAIISPIYEFTSSIKR